ncbi:hypothetical protein BUY72_12550, partial [Staphylococcus epidermidis]
RVLAIGPPREFAPRGVGLVIQQIAERVVGRIGCVGRVHFQHRQAAADVLIAIRRRAAGIEDVAEGGVLRRDVREIGVQRAVVGRVPRSTPGGVRGDRVPRGQAAVGGDGNPCRGHSVRIGIAIGTQCARAIK